MELLLLYLAGDAFRQRVETIVEAFEAMPLQVNLCRFAMSLSHSTISLRNGAHCDAVTAG
jgi:hypothetical protein